VIRCSQCKETQRNDTDTGFACGCTWDGTLEGRVISWEELSDLAHAPAEDSDEGEP
jgi:hypothetical protein